MTLVLTEISKFGIAMAADSAVTCNDPSPTGGTVARVLTGVKKLQVIPKIQAGISVWGQGDIEVEGKSYSTDIWLKDFIENREDDYTTLHDFAVLLQNELRTLIPPIDVNILHEEFGTIGFHLAGFVDWQGQMTPTFYHIHNGRSQVLEKRGINIDPSIINANHDLPPDIAGEALKYKDRPPIWRNGDYQIYAAMFGAIVDLFKNLKINYEINMPYTISLDDRAKWLKFQIRIMAELFSEFRDINHPQYSLSSIGGGIDTVTISSNGEMKYSGRS